VAAALTILGLIGVSTLWAWMKGIRALNGVRHFFRFKFAEPLDIVLTTHSDALSSAQGTLINDFDRVTTQLGYLRAAASMTEAISRSRASKRIRVHVSEGLDQDLSGDLVIFGGTGGNTIAERFLAYVVDYCGVSAAFDETDESDNRIQLGDVEVHFDWTHWSRTSVDLTDFALIIFWTNPFASGRRRAIWCSGFTAAGTMAAANYAVTDLRKRWLKKRKELGGSRWRYPAFALLLAVDFKNDADYDASELQWIRLPLPPANLAGRSVGHTGSYWRIQTASKTTPTSQTGDSERQDS
jgi:hypothetical protein